MRAGYDDFKSRGWLKEAPGAEWYVYRQSTEEHAWTGVVCNLDLQACADGGLKTHEQTLEARETLFASFLENVIPCRAGALCPARRCAVRGRGRRGPRGGGVGVRAHGFHDGGRRPPRDLARGFGHRGGARFGTAWGACTTIYLADGHHRYASSLRLAEARPDLPGAGLMLAYVVPERNLTILGYHKEIRNMGMTADQLNAALKKCAGCDVAEAANLEVSPSEPGQAVVLFKAERGS